VCIGMAEHGVSRGSLPSFLEPLEHELPGHQHNSQAIHINAVFRHKRLELLSHTLWWPSSAKSTSTLLIFVPGNPGLVDFYTPFLTAIHAKTDQSLPILAHAHLGHTPGLNDNLAFNNPLAVSLVSQVESLLEVIDAARSQFEKIVIAGHSVGSWIALQALKARPEAIQSLFLLFPTISDIENTPNGKKLSVFFRPPFSRLIAHASLVTRLIPGPLLSLMFSHWPKEQTLVLRSLLNSPSSIFATLTMAHEEMQTIRDLDVELLQAHSHRMHLYFAENDDWVGLQREIVLHAFKQNEGSVKIVRGHRDIPHAFCINHGEDVAQQCYEWLLSGNSS